MDMQIMRILGDLMSWIYKYNFDHAILESSLKHEIFFDYLCDICLLMFVITFRITLYQ